MTILQLHAVIEAVCPIHGVDADGNISFASEATEAQRAAAIAARDAFAPFNPVPSEVSPYQARKALKDAGVLPAVLALIASLDETDDARMAWEYATAIYRESAFINTLGPALGLSSEQIDNLFRSAAQIT